MDEFKNEIINGIHCSRYVASWINVGGSIRRDNQFKDWLRTLVINGRNLTDDEIRFISNFARNGKLELEHLAKEFLKEGA